MELTAIIKKGEKQYVALCPEVDVVSQGYTIEEAIKNLKEAVELYIEEMGPPEGVGSGGMLVTHFQIKDAKAARARRRRSLRRTRRVTHPQTIDAKVTSPVR
ncbi:MAG: type II toxin-antitoxin system HicB family antitoxin [Candidatus Brocadiales bacterium]|nr:type II toxin-antitoxin system HicB family antitoxin [Candidatus Brocadiales bacterium]